MVKGNTSLTGSLTATAGITGSFTGSLTGTATTASYVLNAISASYAPQTAAFPYTGSAIITGSLNVTGSFNVSGSVRLNGNAGVTVIGNTTVTGSFKVSGSLEYSTDTYGPIQFFSSETNTIYPPRLELAWDDSVFTTGSLPPINTDRYTIVTKNLNKQYDQDSIEKLRIVSRPLFPVRTFSTGSSYNIVQYLPQTSYYQVEDYYTGEALIPYSDYTKISCDSTSNFFLFNFNTLQKNRFYRFTFKILNSGTIKYFKSDEVFSII